jgi:hypothetical protein
LEIRGGDASGGRQGVEGLSIVPSVAGEVRVGLAHRLIVKKEKDFIFPDRAPDAAAELIELIVVSKRGIAIAIVWLIGIQIRLVRGEEEAAVKIIGAALGSDL